MAINQKKYIEVNSSSAATAVGVRDFSGLIITDSELVSGFSDEAKKTAYNNGAVLKFTKDSIRDAFGVSTESVPNSLVDYIDKYFSYVSPSGKTPLFINVAKIIDADSSQGENKFKNAFARISGETDNFGAFAFVTEEDIDSEAAVAVAEYNSGLGNKHLFSVSSYEEEGCTPEVLSPALKNLSGCVITYGSEDASWMMLSWLASIDYNAINAASCPMYKRFSDAGVTVVTDSGTSDTYDSLRVNYIGATNVNGELISFFQRGFNTNGEDTAVYCNEMWLKSAIASAYFNLALSVQRIPANITGAAMIQNLVVDVAETGIMNGTILLEKMLDNTDKAKIVQMANGNSQAIEQVSTKGYFCSTNIVKTGDEYRAIYTLIYAKGDSIRKVDGYNILV